MFYCEIISGLWVGDIDIMLHKKFIKENNINIIINCTQQIAFPEVDVKKVRIPFSDRLENDIDLLKQNKDKILEFIFNQLDVDNILICCYDGLNISPFIVAIFLIKYGEIKKEDVRTIIRTKNNSITLDYDNSLFDL